ncbi:MAG: protein kinase domain-containing protein, partial [Planctomycetota bacterium]
MDDLELRIVESICCVRCGAQCETRQTDDLLVYTCPEDGTRHVLTVLAPTEVEVTPTDDPWLDQTLGPCRIVERAGAEGGLPLYHGLHVALNHPHIVKIAGGETAKDRSALGRFVQTARFAAAVRHTAIANVTHLGKLPDGGLFAVSAPLEGVPLDEALGGERLAVRDALRVARALTEALAGLHAKGIVHRNIGPKSVYLSPASAPLLCNFAFATGPKLPPEAKTVVGQPGYLAPEQAAGGEVDGRADLYALGALLYRMAAGRDPFSGGDASDIVRNQMAGKAPERPPLAAAAPPALVSLV